MYPYKKAFFTAFSFCLLLPPNNANAMSARDAALAVEQAMFRYTKDWDLVANKRLSGVDDAPFYKFGVSGRKIEFGITVNPLKKKDPTKKFIAVKLKFTPYPVEGSSHSWHEINRELYKKMILEATNLQQDGMMTRVAFTAQDAGGGIEFLLHPSADTVAGKLVDQNALTRLLNNIADFMPYLGRSPVNPLNKDT